jgi:hypothetical protein
MRFAASMHQTKAHPFVQALLSHGHEMVRTGGDVFLLDLDTTPNRHMIDHHAGRGAKVFLYPHGPITQTLYDMGFAPDPRVVAHFVPGEGQRELLRRIGVDVPVYTVGWPWSDLAPFRATDDPRRVLFAPLHPLDHDGSMPDHMRATNRRIYEQLLELDVELTVRHWLDLEHNGLYPVDGVSYSPSNLDTSTGDIDAADVVIAVGTFAGLAVARGAPTVMFDQAERPYHIKLDGTLVYPEKWDDYAELLRYPFDIADGPLEALIRAAARSEEPVREWRELFVGGPFDPTAFCTLLDKLRRDPLVESELRDHVVVAFADELVERPELLVRYSEFAGPESPMTLVVYAPDTEAEAIVEPLERALAAARLDDTNMPDILLSAIERNDVYERAIARRASALLSDRDATGPLAGLPRDLNIEAIPAAGSDAAIPHA